MQFQGNSSFLFTKYVHPRELKQFWPLEVHTKKRRGSWWCLNILFSFSLIPLIHFCNRSSTTHQTQRKISSIAKLFSPASQLSATHLPKLSYSKQPFWSFFFSLPLASSRSFSNSPVPLPSHSKPPFSIIALPTSVIIWNHHSSSIPIQWSRHANSSVQLLSPIQQNFPCKSSRHRNQWLN